MLQRFKKKKQIQKKMYIKKQNKLKKNIKQIKIHNLKLNF